MFIIPDTTKDKRFDCNPLVTDNPKLRFYAGALLETNDGLPLGTLCVLDYQPRMLNDSQVFALQAFSRQVMTQLNLRKALTEKKIIEQKINESEKQFRELANSIPQMAWMADETGSIFWYNQRWFDYTGTTLKEMQGWGWEKVHDPIELKRMLPNWKESIATGNTFEDTFSIRRHDGEMRWHLTRAQPIKNDKGKVIRWVGTNTDIEDKRRSDAILREKDLSLRTALHAGRMGTWELDLEHTFLTSSETCKLNYGLTLEEELTYHRLKTLVHEDDLQHWQSVVRNAIETASDFDMEYRIIWPDQSVHWVYVRGNAIMDASGKATKLSGVSIDVTARKLLETAAIEAQEVAESANMAKSEFLANMSHEIRTPMNAVIGLSTILSKSEGLSSKQKDYVRTLQLSADSLLGLINDLLDISKIEARSIELEHIPFSITQMLNEVISMMSMRAKEKGLEFTFTGENTSERVLVGDPMRLRQIIINLCSNAIKFTEKGGVYIRAAYAPSILPGIENVSLSITDTGIGIPADKQETIFHKFIQADSSINRKYGGTGLGLAITKTLTEIMGGTIALESTLGAGSTFTVTIPLMCSETNKTAAFSSPKKPEEKRPDSAHRILLVEDYPANVLVAGSYLELFGYDYDVVDNGYEAVEKAKTHNYLAVLMDVQMPGVNGFEATKLIRAHEKKEGRRHMPIIGMTAHALAGDRERCIAAEMDDYLSKPYNPDELEKKLAAFAMIKETVLP